MSQLTIWFILILCLSPIEPLSSFKCRKKELRPPTNHIEELVTSKDNSTKICTWIYTQKPKQITTVHVKKFEVDSCNQNDCCNDAFLTIGDSFKYLKVCGQTGIRQISTQQSNIFVNLTISNSVIVEFKVEFKERPNWKCPMDEFQCTNKLQCYNSRDICDQKLDCSTYDDEINCGKCATDMVPCNGFTGVCFDPKAQRCNGILDCPYGDDEGRCSALCPIGIQCKNESKCIHSLQICNGVKDCDNNFDEEGCDRVQCLAPKYFLCNDGQCINSSLVQNHVEDCADGSDEKTNQNFEYAIASVCFFLAIVLCIVGSSLICRWLGNRRDIERLLQNLPEFPLPPFYGPGEDSRYNLYNMDFSESDFLVGGEVYDAFLHTHRMRNEESRIRERGRDKTNQDGEQFSSDESIYNAVNISENEDDIMKALATLGISKKMCLGLEKFLNADESQSKIHSIRVYDGGNFTDLTNYLYNTSKRDDKHT